jgi:Flp pilus assembly protein CpaB
MKKRGGRFLLILGAGLAVMAFAVVYVLTSKGVGTAAQDVVPTPIAMVSIAVAKDDLPPYTLLDGSNVAMLDVEASTAVSPTTTDANMLYGKMTLLNLTKGQPIMTNQLTSSGFSNVIEKGKRAFTLPVNERSTFGGTLTENDYVDLLWTHKFEVFQLIPGAEGKTEEKSQDLPTTKTILENVQVLRVISLQATPVPGSNTGSINGGKDSSTSDSTTSSSASSTKRSSNASTASAYAADAPPQAVLILAVTDQQAEVIKFAIENGIIDLALRSSAVVKGPDGNTLKGPDGKDVIGDHDPEKTTGITTKVLVEQYGLLLPEILVK